MNAPGSAASHAVSKQSSSSNVAASSDQHPMRPRTAKTKESSTKHSKDRPSMAANQKHHKDSSSTAKGRTKLARDYYMMQAFVQ